MEITINTTVSTVVVYPDRARVTTAGRAELPAGLHQLIVGELPLALEPESVRAAGAGTARVRLRSVDVQRRHYVQTPSANVNALEEQVERVQAELQALDDRQAVIQSSIDHLDGLRKATTEYAWGLARGRQTVEKQSELMRFFEEEDTRLRGDLRGLNEEQRAAKDELAKLQAELDQLRAARPRQRYEARLEVEVLAAGDFEVEVTYVVGRAGWRPLYDMRLREGDSGSAAVVAVTNLAEITQNTGQDWTGVRLSVSTARPALNQRAPELKPWFIDAYQPPQPQPRMYKAAMARESADVMHTMADEGAPMLAAMAAPAPVAAEVEVAEAQEEGTAVSFLVAGSVDIPGDGTPKKTTLGISDLPPRLDYLAIPRHTDAVYRRAKLTNTTGAPLLAGPVSLYVGDEYIGQNRLEYTPAGGEVDKRLLRDQRQVVYGYEITLENLTQSAANVTVEDQYPVSKHDQIKVRLDRATHEPSEQSELHILKWELNLGAGQKSTIRFEYQVEHARALRVAGLLD